MKHFLLLCMLLISAAGIASSQTIEEKIGEAVQLMDNGAVGKSIVILNEVIEEEPDNYVAQYELGYAQFLNQNYRLCIDIYEKLTTHKECTASVYIMLANSYQAYGDSKKAIEVTKTGIDRFPDSVNLIYSLGNYHYFAKDLNAALDCYLRGMKVDPQFANNYHMAAGLFLNSTYPAWGIIFGEMYMALERKDENKQQQISSMLYNTYISQFSTLQTDSTEVQFANPKIMVPPNVTPEQMEQALDRLDLFAVELPISNTLPEFKGLTFDIETLCRFRKAYTDSIVQGDAINKTNPYVKHLTAVKASGCENAYNHYLLLTGRPDELNKWKQANPFEWQIFKEWFDEYIPYIKDGSYSIR